MVDVLLDDDRVIFSVIGMHKLLAFKSRIEVPRKNILNVVHDPSAGSFYKGMRSPGTHIPGLIAAGTFFHEGKRVFWDVVRTKNCVVVELAEEKYDKLIIEVKDPAGVVDMLAW